jgi:hypothetical protein
VSRKSKHGRVRCGKCYRVLFTALQRPDPPVRDDKDNIMGFYCTKCSIRYEIRNLEIRLGEQMSKYQDLVLTGSDIKTRRA